MKSMQLLTMFIGISFPICLNMQERSAGFLTFSVITLFDHVIFTLNDTVCLIFCD